MSSLSVIQRKLRNGIKKFNTYFWRMQRLKAAVARTPPMPVPADGPVAVHMLCSHRRLPDGVATLKSFYRFAMDRFPLVFHDDGSLTRSDCGYLNYHFPGLQIIMRSEADRRVEDYLRNADLLRCIDLRRSQNYQLKLFDFAIYADGRPFLQLDSDILFFQPPAELLAALSTPRDAWTDRYNQQHIDSYTWTAQQVQEHVGVDLIPQINVGLMCLMRDHLSFELFERCMQIPVLPGMSTYYLEQSLTAIESSRRGAKPLAPDYDIVGIQQQQGRDVVSEHYCSTYRPFFYDHFCDRVAPDLCGKR